MSHYRTLTACRDLRCGAGIYPYTRRLDLTPVETASAVCNRLSELGGGTALVRPPTQQAANARTGHHYRYRNVWLNSTKFSLVAPVGFDAGDLQSAFGIAPEMEN
jgi:hypothetical protein